MTKLGDYPVPFNHAVAAVRGDGSVVWEQGEVGRVFPLASVTKIITSLATLRAVEEGLFDLSSTVGHAPGGAPYTVAHLLSHSSGLAVEGDGNSFQQPVGVRRIYSNQGFDVLGEFLKEKIDVPLPKWIDTQVAAPLGLRATTVPSSPARSGFGNAIDLTLLSEELLNPTLLSPRMHHALTTTVLPGLRGILPGYGMMRNNAWGLGAEIRGSKEPHWTPPSASMQTFGHFGMSGSYLWVDPTRDLSAVFLGSEPFGEWHKENWPQLGEQILEAADA